MPGNDAFTKLLLHMDGANGGVVFPDSSVGGAHANLTAVGDTHTDTGEKVFGTASGHFEGTGDYLTAADHADWFFGDGDFTIDFRARFTSVATSQHFCGQRAGAENRWAFYWDSGAVGLRLHLRVGAANLIFTAVAWAPAIDTWYHVALIRDGNTYHLTVDGVLKGDITPGAQTWIDFNDDLHIGFHQQAGFLLDGYIDEFRISKGIARWTSFPFTPPTVPYAVPNLESFQRDTKVFRGRKTSHRMKTVEDLRPFWLERIPTWTGSDANVTASKLRVDSYNISWDTVRYTTFGGIEVEYEVSLDKDGAGYVLAAILPDTATNYVAGDLTSGVYVVRVRARYHKLTTEWSEAAYNSIDTFDLTSAFTWPATLPQTVSQPRYSEGMVEIVERSQMDSGAAKARRRFTAGVERFSSSMQLTTAQAVTLEEFFEVSVQGGALEFTWTHPRTGAAVKMRFVSPPTLRQIGPAHFSASLALEIMP